MQLPRQGHSKNDSEARSSHTRGGETVMDKNKPSEHRGASTTLEALLGRVQTQVWESASSTSEIVNSNQVW